MHQKLYAFLVRHPYLPLPLILAVTVLTFLPTFANGFQMEWDDQWMVMNHYIARGIRMKNVIDIFSFSIGLLMLFWHLVSYNRCSDWNGRRMRTRIVIKAYLGTVVFLSLCSSCNHSNPQTLHVEHTIHLEKATVSVSLHDIVEFYRYIPLEQSPDCVIGKLADRNPLIVCNNRIYVVAEGIFCFDMQGKFLFSINQKGHARNEFTRIHSVNVSDGHLYLYDNSQWKVLVYDASNGHYLRTVKLPYSVSGVYVCSGRMLMDQRVNSSGMISDDQRFFSCPVEEPCNIRTYPFPQQSLLACGSIIGTTTQSNDAVLASDYWENKVWRITPDSCSLLLDIQTDPTLALSSSEVESLAASRQMNSQEPSVTSKLWGVMNVQSNRHFITGRMAGNLCMPTFLLDRKTGKSMLYMINKKEEWEPSFTGISACDEEYFYRIDEAGDYADTRRKLLENGELPQIPEDSKDKQSYQTYFSVKEEDNPVVVMFKLKHL